MNSRDDLIINKVFPPPLKNLMFVLMKTNSFVVEKSRNLFQRSIKNTLHENEAAPFDVSSMLELLQREITLPDMDAEKLIRVPVFFGLSRNLQHNIFLFLNMSIPLSSSMPFGTQCLPAPKVSLDSWQDFLNNNAGLLDNWGHILVGQGLFNNTSNTNTNEKYSNSLSNDNNGEGIRNDYNNESSRSTHCNKNVGASISMCTEGATTSTNASYKNNHNSNNGKDSADNNKTSNNNYSANMDILNTNNGGLSNEKHNNDNNNNNQIDVGSIKFSNSRPGDGTPSNHTNKPDDTKDMKANMYSREYVSSLSVRSLQRLKSIADKTNCKQFHLTLVPRHDTKAFTKNDNNIDQNDQVEGNIECNSFVDNEDTVFLLPANDVDMLNEEEITHEQISGVDSVIDLCRISHHNSSSANISLPTDKQCFVGLLDSDISLVNEKLPLLNNDDEKTFHVEILHTFFKLFNDCRSEDIDRLCGRLGLEILPEEGLCILVFNMCKQNILASNTLCIILKHTLMSHLNNLESPVSRNVFSCIVDTMKINERVIITGVLSELLRSGSFSCFQGDIIKKLITNEHLKSDGVCLLLTRCFENEQICITEDFISMIEILLNTKPKLPDTCLQNMLLALDKSSSTLSKSLKLMKVLIMLMKSYSEYINMQKILLQKIVTQNSTFMRKSALNMIKNLP